MTVGDRANRTRTAKVTAHNALVFAENLSKPRRNVTMTCAVKTVTTNAILFRPFKGNAIVSVTIRNILMETGLKGGDQRNLRKRLTEHPHSAHVRRIVRGQHGVELLHRFQKVFRHKLNARIPFRKHRLKSNAGNLGSAFNTPRRRIGKLSETLSNRHAMIGRRNVFFLFKIADNDLTRTRLFANTLDATSRHKTLVVHIVKAILKARRT